MPFRVLEWIGNNATLPRVSSPIRSKPVRLRVQASNISLTEPANT